MTSALGTVGSAVCDEFLDKDIKFRPAEISVDGLNNRYGEECGGVYFNFEKPETFEAAFVGIRKLILIIPTGINDFSVMKRLLSYVKSKNLEHIIFMSMTGIENNIFAPHNQTEKYLKKEGFPHTVIRASTFMQKLTSVHLSEIITQNTITVPAGNKRFSFIDAGDVAKFVTAIDSSLSFHLDRIYEITGPELLSYGDVAKILSDVCHRKIVYEKPSIFKFRKKMKKLGFEKSTYNFLTYMYYVLNLGKSKISTSIFKKLCKESPVSFEDFIVSNEDLFKSGNEDENVYKDFRILQNGSDIRGVAISDSKGKEVTLDIKTVSVLSQSFVSFLSQKLNKMPEEITISIGRDTRISGETLTSGAVSGIIKSGTNVISCGICTTPAMFLTTTDKGFDTDGAIMITASHLPYDRNGMKFFTKEGGLESRNVKEIIGMAMNSSGFSPRMDKGRVEKRDFLDIYSAILRELIIKGSELGDLPLEGLKIVVDSSGGSGGFFAEKVLKELGADISGSKTEADGYFKRHTPNPENSDAIASIKRAVLRNKADLGIIFDTDVDRVGAVDKYGTVINKNRMIALMSVIICEEYPGACIVTDSVTSSELTEFITGMGGIHYRFKRGYKNVINEAKRLCEEGITAPLAIETSGHGALMENYFLDDGAYLISKILIKMARLRVDKKDISILYNDLKEAEIQKEIRIKITAGNYKEYGDNIIYTLLKDIEESEIFTVAPDNRDGIRVYYDKDGDKGWFMLRMSLHEAIIPLNIETNGAAAFSAIKEYLDEFLKQFDGLEEFEI